MGDQALALWTTAITAGAAIVAASSAALLAALFASRRSSSAALLGALFASRRYRLDHIWDRKFETYSSILNAINDMLEELDRHSEAIAEGGEISREDKSVLAETSTKAMVELRKQRRIGSLILDEKAVTVIARLLNELQPSYWEASLVRLLDISYAADALITLARHDLETQSAFVG